MARIVGPGHTFATQGTLAAHAEIIGEAGTATRPAGGVIRAIHHADNLGTITLYGATTASATGATLLAEGVLTNAGLITVWGASYGGGAALLAIENTASNAGTITVQAGLDGAGGQLTIDAGATLASSPNAHAVLTLAAATTQGSGSATLTDTGVLINAVGNTINVDGASYQDYRAAGAQLLVAGTLQNAGTLNVVYAAGGYPFSQAAGTISVTGRLQNTGLVQVGVGEGGSGSVNGFGVLLDSGTIVNMGSITSGGGGGYFAATIDVTGVLDNSGDVTLRPGYYADRYEAGKSALLSVSGVLTNSGTVLLQGGKISRGEGGRASIAGRLTNTGAITVQQAAGLSVATTGVLSNNVDLTIDGGTVYVYTGRPTTYDVSSGTLDINGTLSNSGLITLGGGVSDYYAGFSVGYYQSGVGAVAAVSGVLTNTGAISLGGGDGYYYNVHFSDLSHLGTGATLSLTGALTNQGSIELHAGYAPPGGYYGTGATLTDSGTLTNAGTILIDGGPASALLTVTAGGTLTNTGTIEGTGRFDNACLLTTSGGTIATTALLNTGTIALAANTALTIDSAITAGSAGVVDIAAHATLSLAGSVVIGQHIAFTGAGATLVLASPASFAGSLTGFAPGDTIDFATFSLTAVAASGDALDLTLANGATFDLRLDAPFAAGSTLHLQTYHHGGTDLTLQQASNAIGAGSFSDRLIGHDASGASTALGGVLTIHPPS